MIANRNPTLVRNGQAASGADPFNTITRDYDERNMLFQEIRAQGSPLQSTKQFDYDANQNLVSVSAGTESGPRITTFSFDGYGRQSDNDRPDGQRDDKPLRCR